MLYEISCEEFDGWVEYFASRIPTADLVEHGIGLTNASIYNASGNSKKQFKATDFIPKRKRRQTDSEQLSFFQSLAAAEKQKVK